MHQKQKLTALVLALSLFGGSTAFARGGAPKSQFGFKGWPYRQNSSCWTTPAPTATPTAAPSTAPTEAPQITAAPVPTAVPTATPAPTQAPTAAPTPKPTQKPVETMSPPSNEGDYTTGSVTAQEENAFLLLNQDRKANGLSSLKLDPVLCEIARQKSRDMHINGYFSHTSPTYGSPSQMLHSFGYSFTSVAENIAHHSTIEKAQAAFMSSTGHRRNILGSQWSKVGIGVRKDSQGFVYVTQLFVR
ncbi:MAG: serine protease [Clostridia bacterium]|nr:serine protease [Clostridia bacterium]